MPALVIRVITALVAMPVLLLIVWAGFPWLTILVALVAIVGVLEFCGITLKPVRRIPQRPPPEGGGIMPPPLGDGPKLISQQLLGKGNSPFTIFSILWAISFILAAHFMALDIASEKIILPVTGVGFLVSMVALLGGRPGEGRLFGWSISVGAAIYIGGLLSYALLIRGLEQGWQWLYLTLSITFATDTVAFFVGRSFGRKPMAPTISPGKTWAGAVGGFLVAPGISVIVSYILALPLLLWQAAILGALLGIWGQVGDLVESFLKRSAGAKESGWIIPGHGGVLDRLDSIVFNLVIVYYFVIWGVV
ncbi:MAG: phosphatidate cytidylyltransferase [Chloroflexi bacterium]|nr:phosphatidate cytidylyltransferase [Chloroflexota bacterium]